MIAVILAAGVGSRLGRPFPKSLSMLPTGERILGRQIRLLREAGVQQIYIVIGFKKTLIMEEFPDVFYRYNPFFYITNTAKSLLCGIKDIDDDVIWMNGDVVFDVEIIQDLVKDIGSYICVDRKSVGEEEVKYTINEDGLISMLSKTVPNPLGEAIGINMVTKELLPSFKDALKQCSDMDYFESAVEILAAQGKFFAPMDISQYKCIEVDFEEDLKEAIKLFSK
ncbi:NTP transferase domain-containing protein [Desulfovibrio inopinatus]|uniref:phosphocholine cytidylyltransferase family protein n=1 Tax=Desulfovibrio inopinatus TaxID=102109 RepID=UPI0003F7DE9D|nr:phosphocholine cytidylyltransferase family protein [Desulfovibrio inopinatus]